MSDAFAEAIIFPETRSVSEGGPRTPSLTLRVTIRVPRGFSLYGVAHVLADHGAGDSGGRWPAEGRSADPRRKEEELMK